jgi:hypothetical protein
VKRGAPLQRRTPLRARTPLQAKSALTRGKPLRQRSAKTEALYRAERRPLVADLFAEPSICEVPWCTAVATDPHEPLTRARGGSITDPANVRKVCHPHNVQFANDEQPWMYELGFLRHSWSDSSLSFDGPQAGAA